MNLNKYSIKTQLPILLLLILSFSLIITMLIFINLVSNYFVKETITNIKSISSRQFDEINLFLNERNGDIYTISRNNSIEKSLADQKIPEKELIDYLENYLLIYKYKNIYFLNPNGKILFNLKHKNYNGKLLFSDELKNSELTKSFIESNNTLEVAYSKFSYFSIDNSYYSFICSPVFSKGKLVGLITLQLSSDNFASNQNYKGLGETGEILTLTKADESAVILSHIRNDKESKTKTIKLDEKIDYAFYEVLNGRNNFGEILDYRNVKTFSSWKFIPEYNIGIVVKIDKSEALGFINKIYLISTILILIILGLSYLLINFISKKITAPIIQFKESVKMISGGNLNLETYKLESNLEFTELSSSFEEMKNNLNETFKNIEKKNSEIEELNLSLEIKVEARTEELQHSMEELEASNEELEASMISLKNAQDQLVQTEKMASLGNIIAGVAHELNTPFGAIRSSSGNIKDFLSSSLKELPDFFEKTTKEEQKLCFSLLEYSLTSKIELVSEKELRGMRKELSKELDEWNIEDSREVAELLLSLGITKRTDNLKEIILNSNYKFILETIYKLSEINKNTNNISTAVEKASKIIFALKSFSRFDHSGEKIKTDIIDNIETVLVLYHNYIKHGIELIREFDIIPQILVFPDELNQVWTNLIHNALQAMDYKGKLIIRIKNENMENKNCILVEIEDSGKGIPEEIQNKIFEPFFTTKPQGEGSGLGLDIVSKILRRHDAIIKLNSKVGVGTTFKIYLPIVEKSL